MYDLDRTPFHNLIDLQMTAMREYGRESSEYTAMEGVVQYWSEHDEDDVPGIVEGVTWMQVECAIADMVAHRDSQS